MTLVFDLPPDVERRLQIAAAEKGVAPGEFAVLLLDEKLSDGEKRKATGLMLDQWLAEADEAEDREAYDELTKAIDEDRPSYRKLFPAELKGITW